MKFLEKSQASAVISSGVVYRTGHDNSKLRALLLQEQKNFCAYTEKHIEDLDSVEVEHFNYKLKDTSDDSYFNWYATLRKPNLYKKDEKYVGTSFFTSLFFQKPGGFSTRIRYINEESIYEEININDTEARDLIDFLGLNDPRLVKQRKDYIERHRYTLTENGEFHVKKLYERLRRFPVERSFITALEHEFDLDLSEFYK